MRTIGRTGSTVLTMLRRDPANLHSVRERTCVPASGKKSFHPMFALFFCAVRGTIKFVQTEFLSKQ
jgi:hypothetical protein